MDILKLEEPISIHADFFDLGGNSLLAGVVQGRMRTELNLLDLPATLILEQRTISDVAEFINADSLQQMQRSRSLIRKAWLSGHGDTTKKHLLKSASTFLHRNLLEHLNAEDMDLKQRLSAPPEQAKMPFFVYCILQYFILAIVVC